jgi:PAS domain S-box-containing protein
MKVGDSTTRKERMPQKNMKRNARITDRKIRHAKVTEENGETFGALAENANDGILVAAGKGIHVYANRRASEITGYSPAELLKVSIKDLAHPDEIEKLMDRYYKRLAGEPVPRQYETIIVRKDGKSIPIELTAAKTVWQGKPADLVIIRDITERKKIEEALRESEERFRQLSEASFEGILIHDRGKILDVNETLLSLFGYSRDEVIGRSVLDFAAPESRELVMKNVLSGYLKPYEALGLRKGGTRFTCELIGRTIPYRGSMARVTVLRDVTERKQAEEQLRYQAYLLANVNDAIVASDAQYRLTAWNAAAESLYGWKAEEVLGRNGLEIIRTEWLAADAEEMRRKIAERGRWHGEVTQARKDGTRVPAEVSSVVLRDESGQIVGYVSVNRDITEHKNAEKALQNSALQWQTTFDAMKDAVSLIDSNGKIVRCNKAMIDFLKKPLGEVIGHTCWEIKRGSPSPDVGCLLRRVLQTHKRETMILPMGDQWFNITIDPLLDDSGNLVGGVHIISDITERKKAEETLRESKEKYRNLIENISDVIFEIDGKGVITYISPVISGILDYTADEIIGKSFMNFVNEDDRKSLSERFSELQRGVEKDFEYRLIHKSGDVRWVRTSTKALFEDDTFKGGQGTLIDITECKKVEEKMRLNEARLQSLYYISQYKSENVQGLLDYALDEAIKLTKSKVGWFGFYQEENKTLTIAVWSAEAMKECEMAEKQYVFPLKNAGIWAEGIRRRNPFLTNDFQALGPTRNGYPPGHLELFKFLTIPLFSGDAIVAVIAIANKEEDYDETDVLQLTLLMNSVMEIIDHRKAEEALRESEERYRALFVEALDGLCLADAETGIIIDCNKALTALVGRERMELIGHPQNILHPPSSNKTEFSPTFTQHLGDKEGQILETQIITKTGEIREVEIKANMLHLRGRKMLQGIFRDITERKRMEQELENHRRNLEEMVRQRTSELEDARIAALNLMQDANIQQQTTEKTLLEKETLLQEVHHRVKNNLQVISSLIDMQRAGIKDPHIRQVLLDSQARIRAMAIIHEKLYQSRELGRINVEEYVRVLIDHLAGIYRDQAKNIVIEIQVDKLSMDIDTAIPCGLIINELASNAFKYAFAPEWSGNREVRLKIRKRDEGTLSLEFSDNGGGIPEALDIDRVSTLGLRLVSMLVRQLKGTLELSRHGGTSFLITFPYSENKIER